MFYKVIITIILIIGFWGNAFPQIEPKDAPLNPAFVNYQKLSPEERKASGYIPPPVISKSGISKYFKFLDLPGSFDLRKAGYTTPVKDQKNTPRCGIYSSLGAIESQAKMSGMGTLDFSEDKIADYNSIHYPTVEGSNYQMINSVTSSFEGPVCNIDNKEIIVSPTAMDEIIYPIEGNMFLESIGSAGKNNTLPDLSKSLDGMDTLRNLIKQIIYFKGAVATTLYWDYSFYNYDNYTYYCNMSNEKVNHGVVLMGWDDNMATNAPQTGAWIAKNSWGTSFGDSGYFYLSYFDSIALQGENAIWIKLIESANNNYLYMNDELGGIFSLGYHNLNYGYGLTKFKAANDFPITKIMTWNMQGDAKVSFWIYDDFDSTKLTNLLSESLDNYREFAGYAMYDLPEPLYLSEGNDFYVKVKYEYPDTTLNAIPCEHYFEDYCAPFIQTGKYWCSSEGVSWLALGTGTNYLYNLAIRAYAEPSGAPAKITVDVPELIFDVKEDSTSTKQLKISNNIESKGQNLLWSISDKETETLVKLSNNSNAPYRISGIQDKHLQKNIKNSGLEISKVYSSFSGKKLKVSEVDADVNLVMDDGSAEIFVGLRNGGQILWLNRFTPDPSSFPFNLDEIQILFSDTSLNIGEFVDIYIYEDTDGDGDPGTNAHFLSSVKDAEIQVLDGETFSVYPVTGVTLNGPGDVIIAVVNRTAAINPGTHPAALDIDESQNRSWIGWYDSNPGDPPEFPAENGWGLIDGFGTDYRGNWLIRGYGTTFGYKNCLWLSEYPVKGTVNPGNSQIVDISVNAAGMSPGSYKAELVITCNDSSSDSIFIPVTMNVVNLLSVDQNEVVNKFELTQNYPNPFNPITNLQYSIGNRQFVTLKVYDILGREVATIVNEEKPAGNYRIKFDASSLSSGTYFYRLRAGDYMSTKKFILLK